ncbi:hypothetical protein GCK32_006562 [Trichostrongylus colubriformis]|uniref:Uncharacterized protein n=1 Tax=Trichostrongylus colubriformis TaxID=6319 RepID=A0AAN8FXF7_TRICO
MPEYWCEIVAKDGVSVTFGYINTDTNPADCATRGLSKDSFAAHPWWNDPRFLIGCQDQNHWPPTSALQHRTTASEESAIVVHQHATKTTIFPQRTSIQEVVDWKRYSSVAQATCVFSYALRWLNRILIRVKSELKEPIFDHIPHLRKRYDHESPTVAEREQALSLLIRNHQRVHVEGKISPTKDRLIPVMDPNGLIRCRGRLLKSDLAEDSKQPILLDPKQHSSLWSSEMPTHTFIWALLIQWRKCELTIGSHSCDARFKKSYDDAFHVSE